MDLKNLPWPTIVAVLAIAAGGLVLAGAIFVWSGLYNVAASRDHFSITTWLFETIREQSVETYSSSIEAPSLDDDGMIRLGAAHYEGGCVPCHGRPGEPINPIAGSMLPPPPDLTRIAERQRPEEIFWIAKHGLKYTGMPAWPGAGRDDEVWAITSFLTHLRRRADDYPRLAGLDRNRENGRDGLLSNGVLTRCARCHETGSASTNGDHVPKLAGQSELYLLRSLREYAEPTRESGVMEPVADLLDDRSMRELAAYYSALQPITGKTAARDPERLRRGGAIATDGIPQQQVPACMSCHSGRQSPFFPLLAGQHAEYIAAQLRLWQQGSRARTPYGRIMAAVAGALKDEQIEDVSAYLASLPAETAPVAPVAEVGR